MKKKQMRKEKESRKKKVININDINQFLTKSHLNCYFGGMCSLDAPVGSYILHVLKENALGSIIKMAFILLFF